MNFEIVNSVHSRENELKDYLKKLQQPKTEKSVWQGGERKQDNKPDSKGPRDNDKGKGQFQKGQGKGEGNQGQFQKGEGNQGQFQKGQGQFQGKGKKGKKKAENAKVSVTTEDKDGFLTERILTQQENEVYEKTGKLPELKVEQVATVVETKKPVKKQINTAQVVANNPFSAVLLAGSYDAPEVDIAKNQQRKAQAAKKNKVKQQKLGEVQNQQIKHLEKLTSQQQAAGKKTQGGKNNKKKGAVQFVNKPAPKQKQQPQQKKATDKPKQKDSQEAHNKKQQVKKQQAEAEKKRQEKEEQRILANQRDIEKEKKLRRLARKNQKEEGAWYENEYAQPAALVGACTIFLAVVYSFVFQA